jgi:PTS system nitrogen regulatory IIA component
MDMLQAAMNTSDPWLRAQEIELDVPLSDKRMVLMSLSQRLAERQGGSPLDVFDALWQRELLGSTGLGHGVALPHARLEGMAAPIGAFLRLRSALPFDAPDGNPVRLVLALLLPRQNAKRQLQLLAQVADVFADAVLRDRVARTDDPRVIAKLFTMDGPS